MAKTQATSSTDDAQHRARLREILDDAPAVLLTTRGRDRLHTRPMDLQRVDEDGTMYFSTSSETAKTWEIEADPRVQIAFQGKTRFAVVDGSARLVQDRALVDELWKEDWKLWFPDGKSSPDIVIVVVEPERGEYWDMSGAQGLSFLFRAAKAYLKGDGVETRKEDHAKVRL
ncbi:MAG TPA: nitroreductase/quinone reductase family protein [Kofleriaceae bacterium]|nr:nitroreductase/quinone reductase family protein [Kofleriaceae bacterium]